MVWTCSLVFRPSLELTSGFSVRGEAAGFSSHPNIVTLQHRGLQTGHGGAGTTSSTPFYDTKPFPFWLCFLGKYIFSVSTREVINCSIVQATPKTANPTTAMLLTGCPTGDVMRWSVGRSVGWFVGWWG